MKANLHRTLSAVLLSSILLTFTACRINNEETKHKIPQNSSSVSETVSENTVDESSEDKSALTSEKEKTSSGPSSEKSEEKSKEKTESSKTTSEKTTTDEAEQALKDYEASMQKEGVIEGVFPEGSSDKAVWKVNKTKIDDFNNDGQPELIIQYYCGFPENTFSRNTEKQGIAIGIVRFINGSVQEFRTTDNLARYVRVAGAEISGETEICDEPYIDENGNIGILVSKYSVSGAGTWLSYAAFTDVAPFNFCVLDCSDHKETMCFEFNDFFNSYYDNDNVTEITKEEAKQRFDKIKALNKIDDFKVTSDAKPLSLEDTTYASIS